MARLDGDQGVAAVYAHATEGHITDPEADPEEVIRLIDGLRAQTVYQAKEDQREADRQRHLPQWTRLREENRAFRDRTIELARLLHEILGDPRTGLSVRTMEKIETTITKLHQTQRLYGPAAVDRAPQFLD